MPLLSHTEFNIRKEASWMLYLLGTEGTAIDSALPALEPMLDDTATQGNAAIASHLANQAVERGLRSHHLPRRRAPPGVAPFEPLFDVLAGWSTTSGGLGSSVSTANVRDPDRPSTWT